MHSHCKSIESHNNVEDIKTFKLECHNTFNIYHSTCLYKQNSNIFFTIISITGDIFVCTIFFQNVYFKSLLFNYSQIVIKCSENKKCCIDLIQCQHYDWTFVCFHIVLTSERKHRFPFIIFEYHWVPIVI